jgi:hypothetical protein
MRPLSALPLRLPPRWRAARSPGRLPSMLAPTRARQPGSATPRRARDRGRPWARREDSNGLLASLWGRHVSATLSVKKEKEAPSTSAPPPPAQHSYARVSTGPGPWKSTPPTPPLPTPTRARHPSPTPTQACYPSTRPTRHRRPSTGCPTILAHTLRLLLVSAPFCVHLPRVLGRRPCAPLRARTVASAEGPDEE